MNASHLGIDSEELTLDILPAIESSFGISFLPNDLVAIDTYGALCAAIQAKLPTASADDCTMQQAFYKLRQAWQPHTTYTITPSTQLAAILPPQRAARRQAAAAIERSLNMKLELVGMSAMATTIGGGLLVAGLFIAVAGGCLLGSYGITYGLATCVLAAAILRIGSHLGDSIRYAAVRDVEVIMSSQFYRQSRRDPATANHREITRQLTLLFIDRTGVEPEELRPEAIL